MGQLWFLKHSVINLIADYPDPDECFEYVFAVRQLEARNCVDLLPTQCINGNTSISFLKNRICNQQNVKMIT
jgi:hypothetical protein